MLSFSGVIFICLFVNLNAPLLKKFALFSSLKIAIARAFTGIELCLSPPEISAISPPFSRIKFAKTLIALGIFFAISIPLCPPIKSLVESSKNCPIFGLKLILRLNFTSTPPALPMQISFSFSLSKLSNFLDLISNSHELAPINPLSSSFVKSTSKSSNSRIIAMQIATPIPSSAPKLEFFALKNPSF